MFSWDYQLVLIFYGHFMTTVESIKKDKGIRRPEIYVLKF